MHQICFISKVDVDVNELEYEKNQKPSPMEPNSLHAVSFYYHFWEFKAILSIVFCYELILPDFISFVHCGII